MEERPSLLEREIICHKIIEDIHGDKPIENKDKLLKFPPTSAVEKDK
ncbi:hypothetical protein SMIDD26_01333 [Streptococcus mitis]|uniref:Uncharacterized protein n=1 Tax=Streptococcus mitis TaxID=28037 RepID=A0A139PPL9_STRMT|nr:hypothetical protein SMIDD26_01333 [Streptococcus mitis]